MAILRNISGMNELCKALNIEFELLKAVQENKEFVVQQLRTLNAQKRISDVIEEFIQHLTVNVKLKVITARTAENYTFFFRPFLDFIKMNYANFDIHKLDMSIFNQYLLKCKTFKNRESVTIGTRNTYLKFIRKMMYFALDKGYLFVKDGERYIKNKFHWDRVPREPKCIPDNIIREALRATTFTTHPYRNHAIICTLLATGSRIEELIKLKVNHINFEKGYIKLTGKNNKTRYVTLYPFHRKVLLDYLRLREINDFNSDVYLFTTEIRNQEKQITKSAVQKMIKKIFTNLGYPDEYSAHCFRHTFAVNCLKAGMEIQYIAELLGHEHIETTKIYTTMLPEDLLLEVQKYPLPLEKVLFTLFGVEEQ